MVVKTKRVLVIGLMLVLFSYAIFVLAPKTANADSVGTSSPSNTASALTSAASIPVGISPYGVAINPSTNTIYVANFDSNTVSVINGTTNTVTATILVGTYPFAIAINPSTNTIYVANGRSNTVSVINAPLPPTGLTATVVSSSQINLSWNTPSSNGGSAITGYMIERSVDNGTTWSIIVSNTDSTSTTYSDTGLHKKTTYTYRIHAINDLGISLPSNIVSATTLKNNHLQHHK